MEIIRSAQHLQNILIREKATKSIGFVPTMGALHEGHLSLVKAAKQETDIVVVSIFVNPTQFNNSEDFEKYPKTLDADKNFLKDLGINYLFLPENEEIYSDHYNYTVQETKINKILCGEKRPGHFSGVLTVVLKLLQITQPHKLYLGEKDFQQVQIIKEMLGAFFIPVTVRTISTVRDEEGLALSSRNQRLDESGIAKARLFAQVLKSEKNIQTAINILESHDIKVDYLEEHWNRRFGAVFVNNVRLIDNVPLS